MLIYSKLHEKSYCYLLMIYKKKAWQKVETYEILTARAICNLHSYYNFALVFHEKCTVSSQSDAHNLFSYIIK